ncbi:DUF397 domain-containing protein [Streptosporangium sp. V21-05]|uniref:DUF397 domain-containing protein n=1 Tax=Streptosporangium sp. V21-05 TaxID=3446115 RepID=UPI003F52F1A2
MFLGYSARSPSPHCLAVPPPSNGGNCVEVAGLSGGRAAVRDSKDPSGPALVFTRGEWAAFVGGVRNGEFD